MFRFVVNIDTITYFLYNKQDVELFQDFYIDIYLWKVNVSMFGIKKKDMQWGDQST